jgi:hypothetical protein
VEILLERVRRLLNRQFQRQLEQQEEVVLMGQVVSVPILEQVTGYHSQQAVL